MKEKKGGKGAGKKGDKGGKGGGKKGGPRVCFECGAEDHLANACPVRFERVAAGGPERVPKDNPMKGCKKRRRRQGRQRRVEGLQRQGIHLHPDWASVEGCCRLGRSAVPRPQTVGTPVAASRRQGPVMVPGATGRVHALHVPPDDDATNDCNDDDATSDCGERRESARRRSRC